MSLRIRFTVLVALAVAVTVTVVTSGAFFSAARELRQEVDDFLISRAAPLSLLTSVEMDPSLRQPTFNQQRRLIGDEAVLQFIDREGKVLLYFDEDHILPINKNDLEIAATTSQEIFRDVEVGGVQYRMLTAPLASGGALQIARSLTETEAILDGLLWRLVLVGGLGVLMAAAAGWIVAGRALLPVAALTEAAEHVADTQDLTAAIDVEQTDEVGRLARAFNTMLGALGQSRLQQQRLVRDASHELRTPLTSLRTNIEVLARSTDMSEEQRKELLEDVTFELEQLTTVVGELVELATDTRLSEEPARDVHLGELVDAVAERSRRRYDRPVEVLGATAMVRGRSGQIDRAVSNLIDNANKWSPPGEPITVTVHDGGVTVRDKGKGFDPDDLPFVFDRFYRSPEGRAMPGSGLGLAIVKQIIESHGGRVWARNVDEGGAEVGFEIPSAAPEEPELPVHSLT
ncbi:MAG: HAMP domain-containing histidine kinase [Acidimicrobiia bacterium]|nr:HAMP domain-containing histidine kinase [Acidimicrobiia bacterium]